MTQESELTTDIEDLRKLKHHLTPNNRQFIQSILDYHSRKGYVSEKQAVYVRKYAMDCRKAEDAKQKQSYDTTEEIFDGKLIKKLFDSTAGLLKFPRIRLQNSECPGGILQLHRAGERSRTPGWIIVSNGQRAPNYSVYASVDLGGDGEIKRSTPQPVKKFLRDFAKDPGECAAVNGRETGVCCFCGLGLTHPTSLHHGYGPICAEKYNLPWAGDRREATAAEVELYPVDGLDKLTMEDL